MNKLQVSVIAGIHIGLVLATQIILNISIEAKYSIPQSLLTTIAILLGVIKISGEVGDSFIFNFRQSQ